MAKKLQQRIQIQSASDSAHSCKVISEHVDAAAATTARVDAAGDPTVTIDKPAPGTTQANGAAFDVSGTVSPSTAIVSVGLQQTGGKNIPANPQPATVTAGTWKTQVTPDTAGDAVLGACASVGTASATTSEMITIK